VKYFCGVIEAKPEHDLIARPALELVLAGEIAGRMSVRTDIVRYEEIAHRSLKIAREIINSINVEQ
jgi:hypothetical protein